jgi:hypothetical protein
MLMAAMQSSKDLDSLTLAQELMRPKLARRRRNSHLADLAGLLLERPLVSAPMAARTLKVSQQAVQRMLSELKPIARYQRATVANAGDAECKKVLCASSGVS